MTSSTTQDLIERITRVTDVLMHSEWKASIPVLCVLFMNHMAGIPLPVPAVHDIRPRTFPTTMYYGMFLFPPLIFFCGLLEVLLLF